MNRFIKFAVMKFVLLLVSFFVASGAWAITPYIMGDSVGGGTLQSTALSVETKLKSAGFKIIRQILPKVFA